MITLLISSQYLILICSQSFASCLPQCGLWTADTQM